MTPARRWVLLAVLFIALAPLAEAYNFTGTGGRKGRAGLDGFTAFWDIPDDGTLTWYLDRNELPLDACDAGCFAALKARVQPELDKWSLWARVNFSEAASLETAQIRIRFITLMVVGAADYRQESVTGDTINWGLMRIDPRGLYDWNTQAGLNDFAYTILHEAGHALGIGDLYQVDHGATVFEGEDFVDHGLPSTVVLPDPRNKYDNVMERLGQLVLDNNEIHAAEWLFGNRGPAGLVTGELKAFDPGNNANHTAPHHGITQSPYTWTYRGTANSQQTKVTLHFGGILVARSIGPGNWSPTIFSDRVEFDANGSAEGNFKFQLECNQTGERYGQAQVGATAFTMTPSKNGPDLNPWAMVYGADCPTQHVDPDGSDTAGDGSASNPYQTIQQAFHAAGPTDTIAVGPGTYEECLVLTDFPGNKSIRLIARDWLENQDNRSTVIDGTGRCDGVGNTAGRVVTIAGTNAAIEGFTITGGGDGGMYALGGVTVRGNYIFGNTATRGGGILYADAACTYGNIHAKILDNTIFGNTAPFGGGLEVFIIPEPAPYCLGFSPRLTIGGTRVEGNTAFQGSGGGLLAQIGGVPGGTTRLDITNSEFLFNDAPGGFGGGAFLGQVANGRTEITIDGSLFQSNVGGIGGGLSFFTVALDGVQRSLLIRDSLFTNNTATLGSGGGIDLNVDNGLGATPTLPTSVETLILGSEFRDNTALAGGGIASVLRSGPGMDLRQRIERTIVSGNQARDGGGIALLPIALSDPFNTGVGAASGSTFFLDSVVIAGNQALDSGDGAGGGLLAFLEAEGDANARVELNGSTVIGNLAEKQGGGIHIENSTRFDGSGQNEGAALFRLDSSLVSGNGQTGLGGFPDGGDFAPPGTGNLTIEAFHNDLFGNTDADYAPWIGDRTGVDGNLSIDPGLAQKGALAYHLSPTSPLVDAGRPGLGVTLDIDGDPRAFDGDFDGDARPDIGADEVAFCVDLDGDGFGDPVAADCAEGLVVDCDDGDPDTWTAPGEARFLLLDGDPLTGETTLDWTGPADPGAGGSGDLGGPLTYDVLRSDTATTFDAATCVVSDVTPATAATDSAVPATADVLYYLVRASNACGGGLLHGTNTGPACR